MWILVLLLERSNPAAPRWKKLSVGHCQVGTSAAPWMRHCGHRTVPTRSSLFAGRETEAWGGSVRDPRAVVGKGPPAQLCCSVRSSQAHSAAKELKAPGRAVCSPWLLFPSPSLLYKTNPTLSKTCLESSQPVTQKIHIAEAARATTNSNSKYSCLGPAGALPWAAVTLQLRSALRFQGMGMLCCCLCCGLCWGTCSSGASVPTTAGCLLSPSPPLHPFVFHPFAFHPSVFHPRRAGVGAGMSAPGCSTLPSTFHIPTHSPFPSPAATRHITPLPHSR